MAAGGMESMSHVPYIMRSARNGAGYGHQTIEVLRHSLFRMRSLFFGIFSPSAFTCTQQDLVLGDGLTDVYNKVHMVRKMHHSYHFDDISCFCVSVFK